jgi:hypothetical protein
MKLAPLENIILLFALANPQCRVRLTDPDRIAHSLSDSPFLSDDPTNPAVSSLPLHLLEAAVYARSPYLDSSTSLAEFNRSSISPAALSPAEDELAEAGLGFSPTSINEFVARIDALNHERSPGDTIHSSDILANEPPTTSITGKHKFAQDTGESTTTLASCADEVQNLATRGLLAALCGPRHFASSRSSVLQRVGTRLLGHALSQDLCSSTSADDHGTRLLGHALSQDLCSSTSADDHGPAVAEFLATSTLPPRLSSLSSSLSQPLAELVLRHRWHCTDDFARRKVLAARLPAATSSLPCITELLGDEVSGDGATDHLKLLSSKLGSSTGISPLAAPDALEVALAPFSSFLGAEGSISHRIATINDAYQRHVTALATVASADLLPTSSSSVTSDAADSAGGRTGPTSIACLQGSCASQLNAVLQNPRFSGVEGALDFAKQ